MAKQYETWAIEKTQSKYFEDCEFIYRKAHPELRDMYLTKSKIQKEIMRFYLQKTERAIYDN